jgi:hypothetical protein
MTGGAAVQLAVTLKQLSTGGRQVSFEPAGIAPLFLVRYICRTFFTKIGETGAMVVVLGRPSRYWGARLRWHFPLDWSYILLWALLDILCLAALAWISADRSSRSSWWLLAMAAWLALFSMYGALGGTYNVSERYAFSSEVLIGLSLSIGAMKREKSHLQKVAETLLLTLFLASGTFEYFYYHRWINQERPAAPDWTSQVSSWGRNPEQELIVWPKGWPAFTLPPRHR